MTASLETITGLQIKDMHLWSERRLRNFWEEYIRGWQLYHGTNTLALRKIKEQHCLSPTNNFFDTDFYELESLIRKGRNNPDYGTRRQGKVFLTPSRELSESYAQRSPEAWSFFISDIYWKERDIKGARVQLQKHLVIGFANQHQNDVSENLFFNLVQQDIIPSKYSLLNSREIMKTYDLFEKYWDILKDERPVVLSFSSSLLEKDFKSPFFSQFTSFNTLIHSLGESSGSFLVHELTKDTYEYTQPVSLESLNAIDILENAF